MRPRALEDLRKPRDLARSQMSFSGADSILTIYNAHVPVERVSLDTDQLLFCSMITGRKVVHDHQSSNGQVIQTGEAFFLRPGSHVDIDCPDAAVHSPTTCVAIEIAADKVRDISQRMSSLCAMAAGRPAIAIEHAPGLAPFPHTPATRQLLDRIVSIFTENHPDRDILMDLSVRELVVRILRYCGRASLFDESQSMGRNGLTDVLNYMRSNLGEPLSIDKLTSLTCMSRSRLYAEFKRKTGCTPGELQQLLRLKEAARRLAIGEAITVVSYDLGFSGPSHFCHRFRKQFGCSPREYRNKLLNRN